MADIKVLAKFILSFEGGYVNDPADSGGPTNKGVTLAAWREHGYDKNSDGVIDTKDVKLLTVDDATSIMKKQFWDKWKADQIKDQSLANILVDWIWGSGKWGILKPQRILGVTADGVVGPKTLAALNSANSRALFNKIKASRAEFFNQIVKESVAAYEKKIGRKATQAEKLKYTKQRFLKGWMRRLNAIEYGRLTCNGGEVIEF